MGELLSRFAEWRLQARATAAYERQLGRHGPSPKGVCWKSEENQRRRFVYLTGIIAPGAAGISVNDLGCGYGALFDFLADTPALVDGCYTGYDVSKAMVRTARGRIADRRASFVLAGRASRQADYSFASGTFSYAPGIDAGVWKAHIFAALEQLWSRTRHGLAFNLLDAAGNEHLPDFFYAEAHQFFDFATRVLSPNVVLMRTRPLLDLTFWVRR